MHPYCDTCELAARMGIECADHPGKASDMKCSSGTCKAKAVLVVKNGSEIDPHCDFCAREYIADMVMENDSFRGQWLEPNDLGAIKGLRTLVIGQ